MNKDYRTISQILEDDLKPLNDCFIPLSNWSKAVATLKKSSNLIWNDKDKKGRPRERDFSYLLKNLIIQNFNPQVGIVSFNLEAEVDQMGMSIRPDQIKKWIETELKTFLTLDSVCRRELRLSK